MKPALLGLLLTSLLAPSLTAQQPPRGDRPAGARPMAGPGQRSEAMVSRLAQQINLTDDQRLAMIRLLEKAQSSASSLREQLQAGHQVIRDAVKEGKTQEEMDELHKQLGLVYGQLVAVQSKATGEALKLLTDDQKAKADMVCDAFSTISGVGGRGGTMMRGGPGGPGGFGGPGRPGGPGNSGERPARPSPAQPPQ